MNIKKKKKKPGAIRACMQGIDVTIYAVIGVVHGKYKVHTVQNWQLTVDQVKKHTHYYLYTFT